MTCPDHGDDVVCDREGKTTDGEGFPHRLELGKGQRAALHCARCSRLLYKGEVAWRQAMGVNIIAMCRACLDAVSQ